MRIFITLGMALALISCSGRDKANQKEQSAPGAATATAPTLDPNMFEIRFQVAKGSLPAMLTAEPSAKDLAARTEIVGKDLAAVAGVIGIQIPKGGVGPKCFRVCENQCFGAGENQTCVPRCHIECID